MFSHQQEGGAEVPGFWHGLDSRRSEPHAHRRRASCLSLQTHHLETRKRRQEEALRPRGHCRLEWLSWGCSCPGATVEEARRLGGGANTWDVGVVYTLKLPGALRLLNFCHPVFKGMGSPPLGGAGSLRWGGAPQSQPWCQTLRPVM